MRKALTATLVLLLACAWLAVAPGPAQAGPAAKGILVILDCSGSMWGRVEGQPKIVIAKQVARELLAGASGDVQWGLMAYGHRKKGDCADIELIAPLGAPPAQLADKIKQLAAKGKTPIAAALTQAGEMLAAREGETTLVLVSDGQETCGGDPCAVAAELKKKGLKVVIHVVGFDVSAQEAEQLKCIAGAGGGKYFAAGNLRELKNSLTQIKASVEKDQPLPPAPQPAATTESKSKSKRVVIAGPGTVKLKLASWAKMPKSWALVQAESGQEAAKGNQASLRVKPGEYQIVWQQSEHGHWPALLNQVVKVKSGQTVEAAIDTGLRITAPQGVEPPKFWLLKDPASGETVAQVSESLEPQVVPAGSFELCWRQREHEAQTVCLGRVEITAGKLNDLKLDHGLNLQPADWLKEIYYYAILDQAGQPAAKWSFFAPQLAPPGQYQLVLRPKEHGNNDLWWGQVTIPEHGFADAPINSGAVFTHAKEAKPPYRIIFVSLDNQREYVAMENWDALPLPPGRYRLDWWEDQHGGKRQTLADEVTVEPGVLVEIAF